MKKTKFLILSLSLMASVIFFSCIPSAKATSSAVWFDTSTELVWEYTQQALDESMQLINSNTTYRKVNFTEIIEGPDHLNISGHFYSATEADVLAHGYNDSGIWEYESFGIEPEIYDNDLTTKYVSIFNEQQTNLTQIETLSAADQTYVLLAMGFVLDDILFAVAFLYILAQGFGATFGHNYNSSTIDSVTERNIVYGLDIDFSIDDSGHWQNVTTSSDLNLTYGVASNILLQSEIVTSTYYTEWNGTDYETEYHAGRYVHEIKYPDELLDDFPTEDEPEPEPEPIIPGFSVPILLGSITIGVIPAALIIKRKKK